MTAWLLAASSAASPGLAGRVLACLTCPLCWSMLLSAAGLWLVLPRGTLRGRGAGAILACVSLALVALYLPTLGNAGEQILFWLFAAAACAAAVATISMRSPVYSALCFALTLLATSGLFLLQGAQFLGVATVVVYAGAIVVTFLFVLMLAQPEGHAFYDRISWGALPLVCASVAAPVIVGGLAYLLHEHQGALRFVVAVLPEISLPNGEPLVAPENVLAARLEAQENSPGYLLHLELRESGGATPLDLEALSAQLATKAFGLEPNRLTVNISYASDTHNALASPQHVAGLGGLLFSQHLLSVEVAGTLLLAALVGAVAIIVQGRESRAGTGATGHA